MKNRDLGLGNAINYRWFVVGLCWVICTACITEDPTPNATPIPLPTPLATATYTPHELPADCITNMGTLEITSGDVTILIDDVKIYDQSPILAENNGLQGYLYIVLQLRVVNESRITVYGEQILLMDGIGNTYKRQGKPEGFEPPFLNNVAPGRGETGRLVYHVPFSLITNELWLDWRADQGKIRFSLVSGNPPAAAPSPVTP